MAKRKSTASKSVGSAMRRRKSGTLRSGSGGRVRSRKQAIAIGLNEAREKGADVPEPRKRSAGGARKRAGAKKTKRASSRGTARSTSRRSSSTAKKR
jgi:hypothetical protein